MPQPKDYDPYATDPGFQQQIIVREKLVKDSGNGAFNKFKDAVFLAVVIAVGAIVWNMNQRLTVIEGMMKNQEILIRVLARRNGIDLQ